MKKKALLYVMTAILLGTATMVAPLTLLKPSYYGLLTSSCVKNISAIFEALGGGERMYEHRGALERAVGPSNLSSAGLMLVPSFLVALGVSLYLKKRIRARMLE
jgi:hypothetical protein